ncbi:hypothetical protein CsatB_010444 [Cannabis sativa]
MHRELCNSRYLLHISSQEYVMIVASFSILSSGVGSWPLSLALFISFVLGTAYSINVRLCNLT